MANKRNPKPQPPMFVSRTHLQFKLAKILQKASDESRPILITKHRHTPTHVILPASCLSDELFARCLPAEYANKMRKRPAENGFEELDIFVLSA